MEIIMWVLIGIYISVLFDFVVCKIKRKIGENKKEFNYKDAQNIAADILKNSVKSSSESDIKRLAAYIYGSMREEKYKSYKEGFWNGQQAKIEKVEVPEELKNINDKK